MTVRDVDNGYRSLLRRVFDFGRPRVESGILAEDGAEEKRKQGGDDEKGVTVLDVAEWMEFGFLNVRGQFEVLPRSFVRAYMDGHEPELRELTRRLMQSVVLGQRDKDQILDLLGQSIAGGMQKYIADGEVTPPLAQSTIDAKGSSTPLINTGQLRSKVSYRIVEAA